MVVSRRAALLAGLGVSAVAATTYQSATPAKADPSMTLINPEVTGESKAVRQLRTMLNQAADGSGALALDDCGRRIVEAAPVTYLLKSPLIIGGDTALHANGATFVADYPVKDQEYKTDRVNWHSPSPTYPDTFTSRAVDGPEPTLLLNHVPSDETGLYRAPGNIRVEGGLWDPTAHYLRNAEGDDLARGTAAPPMNAITFEHTHDVEVVGVKVRNVKWWHAVEFNAVHNAALINSRIEGWIENPTSGLWNGDAVQIDIPQETTTWGGRPDRTPATAIRILDNYCGPSDDHPGWGKFGASHAWGDDSYTDVWIERNTIEGTLWDAILAWDTSRITIRENKIINCRGGIYLKTGRNPMQTIDIIGNSVSIVEGSGRPIIGLIGSSDHKITDAAVYGNELSEGAFWYSYVEFRREPQR